MTRAALLLSSLFAAACTVGPLPGGGPGGGDNLGTDAGASSSSNDAGSPTSNGCANRITPADAAHVHTVGGTHAGEGCMVANCHLNNALGAGAPGFQFAGTVYKTGVGKIPSAGATVRIKSAAGTPISAITDDAGNFHIASGSLPNPFPATVNVTACPTVAAMTSTLSQGGGNCTSSACHAGVAAGTAGLITLADQ